MITASKETDILLQNWVAFREKLEIVDYPFEETSKFFLAFPKAKIYTDPYDQSTWPTPWELITENEYCSFNVILGICYTLQLTERFKDIVPEIAITIDNSSKTVYYLLIVDNRVFGYLDSEWCTLKDLPKALKIQKKITMGGLH